MGTQAKIFKLSISALRVFVGAVFVWAGVGKALDPGRFAAVINGYRLVPYELGVGIALYLPWLEIVCGVAAALGLWTFATMSSLLLLTAGFEAALLSAWARGLNIDCGCFGALAASTGTAWPIARNIGLVLAILAVMLLQHAGSFRLGRKTRQHNTKRRPFERILPVEGPYA